MPKVIDDVSNVPDSDYQKYTGPVPPKGLYKAIWQKAWWTKTNDGKMGPVRYLRIAGAWEDHSLYALTAEDFAARRDGQAAARR